MMSAARQFDVAVVGAGPVGAVAALACAQAGARVALFEANPNSAHRLAGEWLHPRAVAILQQLGIDLAQRVPQHAAGYGFAVFPDDGSDVCMLPYTEAQALSCEHRALVECLREAAAAHAKVAYFPHAKVSTINGHEVQFLQRDGHHHKAIMAARIVGADGRRSLVRAALGLPVDRVIYSRMIGVLMQGAQLPYEGYGHVFIGGPGPILAYRTAEDNVRLLLDVPIAWRGHYSGISYLWEAYAPVLPPSLRPHFRAALAHSKISGAANQVRPRSHYGRDHLFLVGDAVGHYHPLTAIGLTLGFGDALDIAQSGSVADYARRRRSATRVAEMLAIGLYDALTLATDAGVATRAAIYRCWRNSAQERSNTMRYLACQDGRLGPFSRSFIGTVMSALARLAYTAVRMGHWRYAGGVAEELLVRVQWLLQGVTQRSHPVLLSTKRVTGLRQRTQFLKGFDSDAREPLAVQRTPGEALSSAVAALIRDQLGSGAWEGEVVWCPMLAAQYVIMSQIIGMPIPAARRESLLLHFRTTQLPCGVWGLHPHSPPYLFVTALVYIAARILGITREDPLLVGAARFIEGEGGVIAIPSWGKFWLAMLNLYDWEGVNPLLPEVWALPRGLPVHPGNFYCHTRLIALAMTVIFAERYQAPPSTLIETLRAELYPAGYARTNFKSARSTLRSGDLYAAPGLLLRGIYVLSALINKHHSRRLRRAIVTRLRERIRWEWKTTDHTSISPVSGLLNIIALWLSDPHDADVARALARIEGWIWEDNSAGLRITGARSACWDTAFALQALAAVPHREDARESMGRAVAFLKTQQIRETFSGFEKNFRIDPQGGWCFAGVWHGWPVSDCSAEAVLALLAQPDQQVAAGSIADAVGFMLRCQNRNGGFGSYEASGTRWSLEWLNPAEMFGDSMTDRSWVECTSSCIAALAACRDRCEERSGINPAITRAARWLEDEQHPEGSWPAAWGVYRIYGTMFGVRGLIAAGRPVFHPKIRKACRWLLARQRPDGGWGEHHIGCITGEYSEHPESQAIQTAWALLALLEAHDPDWTAIERGAAFLSQTQEASGGWPKQDMVGVFFRTALLDYTLYRTYFPLWALGLYEERRRSRLQPGVLDPDRPREDVSSHRVRHDAVLMG